MIYSKSKEYNISLSKKLLSKISDSEFKDISKYLESSPLFLESSFYNSESILEEYFKGTNSLDGKIISECKDVISNYIENELFSETKSNISGSYWISFTLYLIKYLNSYSYSEAMTDFTRITNMFITELFNSIFKEFSFQNKFLSYTEYRIFEIYTKKVGVISMFKSKETLLGFASIIDLSCEDILRIVETGINMIDQDLLQCYYYRYIFNNKDEILKALGKDDSVKLLISLKIDRDLDHLFPLVDFFQRIKQPSKYDELYFINDTVAGFRFLNATAVAEDEKEKDYIKHLFNNIDFLRKLRYLVFEGELYDVTIDSDILHLLYKVKIKPEDFKTEENLKLIKQIVSRLFIGKADVYSRFRDFNNHDNLLKFALDYLYENGFIVKTNNEIGELKDSDPASPTVYLPYKADLQYCFGWEVPDE